MRTAQEIQLAISQLSADELARFREWFDKYDAKLGKSDQFANQAIADFSSRKCKQL